MCHFSDDAGVFGDKDKAATKHTSRDALGFDKKFIYRLPLEVDIASVSRVNGNRYMVDCAERVMPNVAQFALECNKFSRSEPAKQISSIPDGHVKDYLKIKQAPIVADIPLSV